MNNNFIDMKVVDDTLNGGGHIWILHTKIGMCNSSLIENRYDVGIAVLIDVYSQIIGARYWSSCTLFDVCPGCGSFKHDFCRADFYNFPRIDRRQHKAIDVESGKKIGVYWRRHDEIRCGFLLVKRGKNDNKS